MPGGVPGAKYRTLVGARKPRCDVIATNAKNSGREADGDSILGPSQNRQSTPSAAQSPIGSVFQTLGLFPPL